MRVSWRGSMQSALVATLARPAWWAMALAAFLVRGGFILIVLPIVSVPTVASIVTAVSPTLERLWLGAPSIEGALVGSVLVALVIAGLAAVALAGSWLDLALVREATEDEDVDRGWRAIRASAVQALSVRLLAHVPTLLAIAYGSLRLVEVGYAEFLSPSDAGMPVVNRILLRVPDVVVLVIATWLLGETVGALAARRAATGASTRSALAASIRQAVSPRGLATLVLTTAAIAGLVLPFAIAVNRSWTNLRGYLLDGAGTIELGAAVVLLISSWVLGLAILAAALAWRATAWTSEVEIT